MLEKLEIIKDNNDKLTVDFIDAFKIVSGGVDKTFVIITNNELDQNGLIKLFVSELATAKLVKVTDDTDWSAVKNVMRSIISSSKGEFTYCNIPKSLQASDDFYRVIAVQDAAKTQLISDYLAKKPQDVQPETQSQSTDPNAAIYPTNSVDINPNSEVVPGISENVPTPPSVDEQPSTEPAPVDAAPTPVEPANISTPTEETVEAPKEVVNIINPVPDVTQAPVADFPQPEIAPAPTAAPAQSPEITSDPVVAMPEETQTQNEQPAPTNNDELKKEIMSKVEQIVDEYLSKSNANNGSNEEIEKLKKELADKTEKLNNIMQLLGQKN